MRSGCYGKDVSGGVGVETRRKVGNKSARYRRAQRTLYQVPSSIFEEGRLLSIQNFGDDLWTDVNREKYERTYIVHVMGRWHRIQASI